MVACSAAVPSGFAEFLAMLRRTPGADRGAFFLVMFDTSVPDDSFAPGRSRGSGCKAAREAGCAASWGRPLRGHAERAATQ